MRLLMWVLQKHRDQEHTILTGDLSCFKPHEKTMCWEERCFDFGF